MSGSALCIAIDSFARASRTSCRERPIARTDRQVKRLAIDQCHNSHEHCNRNVRTDTESQEEKEGDWVGAQAPAQLTLLKFAIRSGHGMGDRSRDEMSADR